MLASWYSHECRYCRSKERLPEIPSEIEWEYRDHPQGGEVLHIQGTTSGSYWFTAEIYEIGAVPEPYTELLTAAITDSWGTRTYTREEVLAIAGKTKFQWMGASKT